MDVKKIRIEDFDYPLPEGRIALHPLAEREECLLLAGDSGGNMAHRRFHELPSLIAPGSLMVCNDTRVINARIEMRKPTGSRIEIFLLDPVAPRDYVLMFQARGHCVWNCLIGNRKRWKDGSLDKVLDIGGRQVRLSATLLGGSAGNSFDVAFDWDDGSVTWASIVDAAGRIPIPPYLNRESEQSDLEDYQTVYARMRGSVAAPTAGLHFTDALLGRLRDGGVRICPVTLHVGAGTFQPVRSDEIGAHPMHTETFTVTAATLEAIIGNLEAGRPVVAVGTTSVRTLESLPYLGRHLAGGDAGMHVDQWEAYLEPEMEFDTVGALRALLDYVSGLPGQSLTASTSIMIAPGFRWGVVGAMVTNFHQPQSTLLLLVSSFLGDDADGRPLWRKYYDRALEGDYRFLSYGDACFFTR